MISDEPDEDADTLDDATAIETFLGGAPTKPDHSPALIDVADWPDRSVHDIGLHLDAETLKWFKSTYADWRRQMRAILHAWMTTNAANQPPSGLAQPTNDQP
jgi:hypothetical protein